MKKNILMMTVFVLVSGAVMAQNLPGGVSMSFWGQMAFLPFELRIDQNEPPGVDPWDKVTTAIGPGWGLRTNGATSISFRGNNNFIGFGLEIGVDETLRLGENAFVWARPFGRWMRIDVGVFVENEFRGSGTLGMNFGGLSHLDPFNTDLIFNRFSSVSDNGDTAAALLRFFPIRGQNLTLAAYMSVRGSDFDPAPLNSSGPSLSSSIDRIQLLAAYRIRNVGLVRAQFLNAPEFTYSGTPSDENLYGGKWITSEWGEYNSARYYNEFKRLEIAFKLTAVRNLNFDIGFKVPFPETREGVNYSAPILTAFTAGYKERNFTIDMTFAGWFGGGIDGPGRDIPFAEKIAVNLYPQYNFGFATLGGIIGADWRGIEIFNGSAAKNSENLDLIFGLYMTKKFNNGDIKGGFTYTIPDATNRLDNFRTIGWLRIPIVMEIYFW